MFVFIRRVLLLAYLSVEHFTPPALGVERYQTGKTPTSPLSALAAAMDRFPLPALAHTIVSSQ